MPGAAETTFPRCPERHLDVWCLHRISHRAHRAESVILPGGGEVGREMPLTNANVLVYCAKNGLHPADVLCHRVNAQDCPYALETPSYKNRMLWVDGVVVLQFFRDAPNQEAVLEAFEAAGWPHRVESVLPRPLPCDVVRHQLSNTVSTIEKAPDPDPLPGRKGHASRSLGT